MPPFKDEHVLIIAPGSQTTETQLGLPESFTPPRWRFPSRMFPGLKEGEWEPIKIQSVIKTIPKPITENGGTNGVQATTESKAEESETNPVPISEPIPNDIEMKEVAAPTADVVVEEEAKPDVEMAASEQQAEETTTEESWEDDPFSDEGAVYPIQSGRIENWSCFFALLSHIYNMISPPFHMPVMVVAQPCWSARDHEMITQYFFENWKIPAFCLIDAALAACYAYGVPTALVVDVGHDKCDISAVTDFMVNDSGRAVAIAGCGGRGMTKRLQQVLENKGFDENMAERLKKSSLCEILPVGAALPVDKVTNGEISNPAAAASTGAVDSGANAKDVDGQRPGQVPRGPGPGTDVGEEGGNEEEDEGILDVAAIVARDNAAELLAKREAEKAAKAAARKGGAAEPPRPLRLRNSEKEKVTFTYDEYLPFDGTSNENGIPQNRKRKREIEIGVERFMAATPPEGMTDGILDTITAAIHSTILGVPDVPSRSNLWENLIILGNGTRIRGFTPALLSILASRYTLSPSNATMFTSELPSNFSTPVATPGTNTPIPGQSGHPMHHPAGHGVNPLLVAATRNVMQPNQHLQVPGMPPMDSNMHQSHRGFSQSPTSIKTVKPPEYFPEWKDPAVSGMEEAAFLGAQVAAKVIFIVDQGISKGFLTRPEYNDLGPAGIHDCAM